MSTLDIKKTLTSHAWPDSHTSSLIHRPETRWLRPPYPRLRASSPQEERKKKLHTHGLDWQLLSP